MSEEVLIDKTRKLDLESVQFLHVSKNKFRKWTAFVSYFSATPGKICSQETSITETKTCQLCCLFTVFSLNNGLNCSKEINKSAEQTEAICSWRNAPHHPGQTRGGRWEVKDDNEKMEKRREGGKDKYDMGVVRDVSNKSGIEIY